MAPIALANTKVLYGGFDLSGDLRSIALNLSSAMLDATTFSAAGSPATASVSRVAGLKDATLAAAGNLSLGSSQSEAVLFSDLGLAPILISIFPNGITAGSTAVGSGYALTGGENKLGLGSNVGTILPFSASAEGVSAVAKAIVLNDFTASALSTGTTLGTAYQFSPVTTCQQLFAGLHVTGLSTALGTTLQALIQAASSSGFAGATTRITFSTLSCKAGSWATPVPASALSTDQPYWRAQFVLSTGSSTGGSATGLVWMGIQQ